jgi:hypothetical protein
VTVLPEVDTLALQALVMPGDWLKFRVTCQLLIDELPSLVTVTFNT